MITNNQTIDNILLSCRTQLGADYDKYRNHVYRVINLTLLLTEPREDELIALQIAVAFHDLGIWTAHTFDYLKPSVEVARKYLALNDQLNLEFLVTDIILNHHKMSSYPLNTIAEAFRKADLIDLSFGIFSFGVKRKRIEELNTQFPYRGFHRFIAFQALKNTIKHPFNPLPMMKR